MPAGHTAGCQTSAAQARLDVANVGQRQARNGVHEHALAQRRAPPRAPCRQGPHISSPQRCGGTKQSRIDWRPSVTWTLCDSA